METTYQTLPATKRRSFPDIIANTNINIRAIPRYLTFDTSISSTARRSVSNDWHELSAVMDINLISISNV